MCIYMYIIFVATWITRITLSAAGSIFHISHHLATSMPVEVPLA